jgi:hypothetical protein
MAARVFEGPAQDPGAKADEISLKRGERGPWQETFQEGAHLK